MADRQVTLYWSSTWRSCNAAKEFLSSHGVAFTARNVAEDAVALEELRARTGRTAVPVIAVDDEVLVGFDRGRLKRLLGLWTVQVRCPDCGVMVALPAGVKSGDLVECPNWAGHALRVRAEGEVWVASLAHRVSCPECGTQVTLPDGAKAGETIECCGRRYRLTFEYGAFAAEEP